MKHDHDLDGKLHDECPMCEEIKSRYPMAKKDQQAENALARHQATAEKSRIGRDQLLKEEKDEQDREAGGRADVHRRSRTR